MGLGLGLGLRLGLGLGLGLANPNPKLNPNPHPNQVLGCCGVAEGELQGTLSTLQFMRHARRLQTWVRPPQPALAPLHHRLRALQQQLSALLQPPPLRAQPALDLPQPEHARRALDRAADADAPAPKPPRRKPLDWFGELSAHMSTVLRHRTEQAGRMRAILGTLRQITTSGEQLATSAEQSGGAGLASWGAPRASGGLLASPEMLARTTAITQQAANPNPHPNPDSKLTLTPTVTRTLTLTLTPTLTRTRTRTRWTPRGPCTSQ